MEKHLPSVSLKPGIKDIALRFGKDTFSRDDRVDTSFMSVNMKQTVGQARRLETNGNTQPGSIHKYQTLTAGACKANALITSCWFKFDFT